MIGSKSAQYTVSFGPTPYGPYQYDYSCPCPAYEHGHGKHCKHIEQVKRARCAWNEQMDPGLQPEIVKDGRRCPCCKGPIVARYVGV